LKAPRAVQIQHCAKVGRDSRSRCRDCGCASDRRSRSRLGGACTGHREPTEDQPRKYLRCRSLDDLHAHSKFSAGAIERWHLSNRSHRCIGLEEVSSCLSGNYAPRAAVVLILCVPEQPLWPLRGRPQGFRGPRREQRCRFPASCGLRHPSSRRCPCSP
jgi:hypothetical protein